VSPWRTYPVSLNYQQRWCWWTLPYAAVRSLLSLYGLAKPLRSSASKLLQVPRFGSRSFRVSAPILWNSLPHGVRFWKHLKYFIYNRHSLAPQIQFLIFLALYEFIYLLYMYLLTYVPTFPTGACSRVRLLACIRLIGIVVHHQLSLILRHCR